MGEYTAKHQQTGSNSTNQCKTSQAGPKTYKGQAGSKGVNQEANPDKSSQ